MAGVPDLDKSCAECGPQHSRRIVGGQFRPGAAPGLPAIKCSAESPRVRGEGLGDCQI